MSARKFDIYRSPFRAPEHITTTVEYDMKTIKNLSQLKPGDHIMRKHRVYDHHMLVVKPVSDTEVHVIHYGEGDEGPKIRFTSPKKRPDMGLVKEELKKLDPSEIILLTFKTPQETLYPVDEAIDRARTRLGERRWALFTNNCEHFVNWALTGKSQSCQQDAAKEVGHEFAETTIKVGALFGPVVGPVAGPIAGIVKAAKAYKKYRKDVSTNAVKEPSDGDDGEMEESMKTSAQVEGTAEEKGSQAGHDEIMS